jgi:hypothetical protein
VSCTLGCSSDSCSGLSYRESGRIRSLSNAHKFAAPSDNLAPVVGHRLRLGWLVAMVLIIGTLQYLATSSQMAWLYILQRLYYIPVLLAGLIIGWRGGLARRLYGPQTASTPLINVWRSVCSAWLADYPEHSRIDTENREQIFAGLPINCARRIRNWKATLKE